jgi:hypothetical protein
MVIGQTGEFHLTRDSVNRLLPVVVLALAPAVAFARAARYVRYYFNRGRQPQDGGQARRKLGLRPHRRERYVASNDLDFEQKATDTIGLYLNPPTHALVFSCG